MKLLNSKHCVREIRVEDYKKYLKLLSQLTTTGNFTKEMFVERVDEIKNNPYLHIRVIEDINTKELIASGTIYIEPKLIHNCSSVGHIEDIVIDHKFRGKSLADIELMLGADVFLHTILMSFEFSTSLIGRS